MNTREILHVVTQFEKGDKLERRQKNCGADAAWVLVDGEPSWNFHDFDYRVFDKHAEVQAAFRAGAAIEYFSPTLRKWERTLFPMFRPNFEYRVKPEVKAPSKPDPYAYFKAAQASNKPIWIKINGAWSDKPASFCVFCLPLDCYTLVDPKLIHSNPAETVELRSLTPGTVFSFDKGGQPCELSVLEIRSGGCIAYYYHLNDSCFSRISPLPQRVGGYGKVYVYAKPPVIDTSTAEGKIAVMQAFVDGKVVEYYSFLGVAWQPVEDPSWNWSGFAYRVKP